MKNFLIPRIHDIFFIAIVTAALALGPRMLSVDSDLGRHLTLGRFILDRHQIPTSDLLSHTRAGDARPAYEWLTQTIFAGVDHLAGLDGVLYITALVIAAAFTIIQADAARRSQMPLTALAITALAVAASSLHWLPRPHVVTFLFLAVWIERLERLRRGERIPLWHFPLLMLVWANAHGGFLFGILAWLAYFGGWIWQAMRKSVIPQSGIQWLIIGGSSVAASFITPSGWGNWQAVLSNNSHTILSRTVETMPPDFTQPGTWPFASLLAITIIVILVTRKSQPASHIYLLGGFAALALLMARNIPLFAIAAAPVLSEGAHDILKRVKRWQTIESNITALERPLRGALWPILLGLGLALLIGGRYQVQKEALTRFDARVFPVAAADWLAAHPQSGNMFNDINWGGYLLYRLWPEQKVFVDSQTDFYGEALVREYERALTAQEGWENVLDLYAVEWAVLPVSAPLAGRLEEAGWKVLYRDEIAVIARKSRP
jgi:hypothetical protein